MLDAGQSRVRQRRLLDALKDQRLDAVVVGQAHHVYYLTAHLGFWLHYPALVLEADGRATLISANEVVTDVAADDVIAYEASWNATLRQEQPAEVAKAIVETLRARRARRVGVDASAVSCQVALQLDAEAVDVEPTLWQIRRKKDPDELTLIRKAIACTEAMYRRAKEIIDPGVPEITVFNELHAGAVREAGEPLTARLGNDFACGCPGGPPRNGRTAKAGELYILDLGPSYRGYFADNCRAFSVDRRPTDEQLRAHDDVIKALAIVERMAKPGVRCRDLYAAVEEHYRARGRGSHPHHLGHGIGLQPHEYPHLNPNWDDVLMEGEVFTAEPGIYGDHLGGGLRIENDYLVTADGVTNLLNFPSDLV